jgi:hypothetical protein
MQFYHFRARLQVDAELADANHHREQTLHRLTLSSPAKTLPQQIDVADWKEVSPLSDRLARAAGDLSIGASRVRLSPRSS